MHELRQWTYNMKSSSKYKQIKVDNEEKLKIEYLPTDETLHIDENDETLKIEYSIYDSVVFPEIDNINEMEAILSNFKIKDSERDKDSVQEFIKYHNAFNHIMETKYESLQDENNWLNSINALSYQYLPDNYRTKLIEFYENDFEKKKKLKIDKEISDSKPNLLSSIVGYTFDLFEYEENKKK